MIGYLARLKSLNEKNLPLEGTAQTAKIDLHGLCSSQDAQKISISGDEPEIPEAPASRWLLHFIDRNPLEVAFSPEATHTEVLAQYPDALAVEPCDEVAQGQTSIMTDDDVLRVRAWLSEIGETDRDHCLGDRPLRVRRGSAGLLPAAIWRSSRQGSPELYRLPARATTWWLRHVLLWRPSGPAARLSLGITCMAMAALAVAFVGNPTCRMPVEVYRLMLRSPMLSITKSTKQTRLYWTRASRLMCFPWRESC